MICVDYHCDKCKSDFDDTPENLSKRGYRCKICEKQVVSKFKNSVVEEHPELIEWFENPDDAFKYGTNSGKVLRFICPYCRNIEETSVRNFVKRAYHCLNCKQDGISRPNKFLREFLKEIEPQIELKETEWNPLWAGTYLYDGHIVVNGVDYIIEMHGEQHYHQTGRWDFEY